MDKLKRYHYSDATGISEFWCKSQSVAALEKRCAELEAELAKCREWHPHLQQRLWDTHKRSAYFQDRADRLAVMCDALASELAKGDW